MFSKDAERSRVSPCSDVMNLDPRNLSSLFFCFFFQRIQDGEGRKLIKKPKMGGLHNIVENRPNSKAKPELFEQGGGGDRREMLRRIKEVEAVKATHQLLVHLCSHTNKRIRKEKKEGRKVITITYHDSSQSDKSILTERATISKYVFGPH